MTAASPAGSAAREPHHPALGHDAVRRRLATRYSRERRFRWMCVGAVAFAVLALVVLFVDIAGKGWSAFLAAELELEVGFDAEVLAPGAAADPGGVVDPDALAYADYSALWKQALLARFPEVAEDRAARRELFALVSDGATYRLQRMVAVDPSLLGQTRRVELQADDEVGMLR
jgi:phosphate transport system permease protein